ncbi:hypothetical protein BU15DRAFT_90753 [Melanogaster broomeanus]|nr:hypothetical protein BU15DRAFT_90753 [Melanogaster broomeanus]
MFPGSTNTTENEKLICVCLKYGSGHPHEVSSSTWKRHFEQAATEEEKNHIRAARLLGQNAGLLLTSSSTTGNQPEDAGPSNNPGPPQWPNHGQATWIRRKEALRELAKRGRESMDLSLGQRKKAKMHNPSFREQADHDHDNPPSSPPPSSPQQHTPSPPENTPSPPPRQRTPPPPEHIPPPPNHTPLPPGRSPSPPQIDPPPDRQPPSPPPDPPSPPGQDEILIPYSAVLPKLRETMEYIVSLRNASLDDAVSKLDEAALQRIRNPPQTVLAIDAPEVRHSIGTYLALEHSSQDAYERVRYSNRINYPDRADMLSFSEVERTIAEYTGVEKIQNDMCPNTCLAYTGPYELLDSCPKCATSRWNQERLRASNGRSKVAARTFTTITLASQLQARFRHPQSARDMRHLHERTQEILRHLRETGEIAVVDDVVMGWDFLRAVLDGDIKPDDIVLYQSKESDCWIYIWVLLNLSPDKRYKKINVIPGGFIPGPNKPQNVDSFLFPGLHHYYPRTPFRSDIYVLYETADGPGLVYWDGMVGHCGKNGCRVYCGVRGRRKTNQNHYLAALLKPRDRACPGSNHPDVNVFELPPGGADEYATNLSRLVASPSARQYDLIKTATGLTKPPLVLGLQPSHSLGIPFSITTDIMHLVANLADLMLSLWRGTIKCDRTDDKTTWDWAIFEDADLWDEHGRYLPGSFDRKPRNIAEKINTQYKTWEYQLYMYGLAPALLYNILPRKYWQNLCKLRQITSQQIQEAHILLCSWEREFEELYYQRREDRLHFVRPSAHQTLRKGPPICYAQWTMERTIGNLGQEIRQPSAPYANLSQEGVRRCQINALLASMPELADPPKLPSGSAWAENLGDGYALLRMRQKRPSNPIGPDAAAIRNFLGPGHNLEHPIQKWARVQLPNGQIARCAWREMLIPPDKLRVSRNVKLTLLEFLLEDSVKFGEVQYFMRLSIPAPQLGPLRREWIGVAMIRPYSAPDHDLLVLSSQVVASCKMLEDLVVVNIKDIRSVVGMVPHTPTLPSGVLEDRFFLVEKPGLDVSDLGVPYPGYEDYDVDGGDDDLE